MDRSEILTRLTKILIDEFEIDAEAITEEATLYEALALDSLDSVDLIVAVEAEIGFKINRAEDEETIRAMRTMEDVIDFITAKLA